MSVRSKTPDVGTRSMEEIQVPMKQLDEENPDKNFSDERVVGIATGHAQWRVEVVFAVHLHASNFFSRLVCIQKLY